MHRRMFTLTFNAFIFVLIFVLTKCFYTQKTVYVTYNLIIYFNNRISNLIIQDKSKVIYNGKRDDENQIH